MLARLWDSDERQLLTTEKEEVKRGEIIELPELPETWSRRYVELYGHDPPEGVSKKCDDLSLMVDDQKFELLPVIKKLPLEQNEQIVPQLVKQSGSEKAQPDVIDLLDDDNDDEQNVIETTKDVKPHNHPDNIEDDSNNQTNDHSLNKTATGSSFFGLKFSRNGSGTWNMKQPREGTESNRESVEEISGVDEYDEFESIKNELNTFDNVTHASSSSSTKLMGLHHPENTISSAIFKPVEDSDDDEEFSLRDVDTARAVGSILEGADDMDDETNDDDGTNVTGMSQDSVDNDDLSHHVLSHDHHHHDDDHQDIFYDDSHEQLVVGGGFDDHIGDTNSVQNAINSILDTLPQGERMETPDLNNITGFLDSIDDVTDGVHDQERDPVTEAAVNSIL